MHFYINSKTIYQAWDTNKVAWHSGFSWSNNNLLSYEVCQSGAKGIAGVSDTEFLKNEEMTFKVVARDFKKLGITPSRSTIRLHREFSSTDCPYRSWKLHVGDGASDTTANRQKLIDYFVGRVKAHMGNTNVSKSGAKAKATPSAFAMAPLTAEMAGGNLATIPKTLMARSAGERADKAQVNFSPVTPSTIPNATTVAIADTTSVRADPESGSVIGQQVVKFASSFEKTVSEKPVVYRYKAGRGETDPFTAESEIFVDNVSFIWWSFKNVGIELGRSDTMTPMSILNDYDLETVRNYGQKDDSVKNLLKVGDILSFGSNRSVLGLYAGEDRILLCIGKGGYDFSDTAGVLLEPLSGYWWEQFNGIVKRVR